jgi:hypothetical protein
VKRLWDSGFTCNKKKTRKVIQEDYEELYEGEEFTLDTRYAEVLVWIYTIMMFSPGLPGLYMIAFGYFAITYWVDKFMRKYISFSLM